MATNLPGQKERRSGQCTLRCAPTAPLLLTRSIYTKRKSLSRGVPRTLGVVPRTLGVVPRTLRVVPRTLGVVPRTLGVVPRTLGVVPRTLRVVPRTLRVVPRTLRVVPRKARGVSPKPRGACVSAGITDAFTVAAAVTSAAAAASGRLSCIEYCFIIAHLHAHRLTA